VVGSMNRKTIGDMTMADFERAGAEQALIAEARHNGYPRNSTDPVVEPTADELDEQAEVYHDIARRYPQYADWYTEYALRLEALAAVKRREGKCVCNDAEENLCENDATTSYAGHAVCDFHHQMLSGGTDG